MRHILTILFVFASFLLFGQAGVVSLITLESEDSETFYISYKTKDGDTPEGISQKFGKSVQELSEYNDFDVSTVKKYTKIKVPFSKDLLSDVTESSNAAFVYVVQPQETLYTISKKYFQIDIEDIIKWNNLEGNEIGIGDALVVGYGTLGQHKIEPKTRPSQTVKKVQKATTTATASDDNGMASIDEDAPTEELTIEELIALIGEEEEKSLGLVETKKGEVEFTELLDEDYTDQKGIALTKEVGIDDAELFVLHPSAQVDSEMIIINPMLNTAVKAKVVSTMPRELYSDRISVVISPGVAQALGAKDEQFRVEMKYISD